MLVENHPVTHSPLRRKAIFSPPQFGTSLTSHVQPFRMWLHPDLQPARGFEPTVKFNKNRQAISLIALRPCPPYDRNMTTAFITTLRVIAAYLPSLFARHLHASRFLREKKINNSIFNTWKHTYRKLSCQIEYPRLLRSHLQSALPISKQSVSRNGTTRTPTASASILSTMPSSSLSLFR